MSGRKPEGIIGTGSFPGPECPLNTRVRLSAGPTTAVNMLTEVVQQVPGLVWIVTYATDASDSDVNVGLMCSDGSTVMISASTDTR